MAAYCADTQKPSHAPTGFNLRHRCSACSVIHSDTNENFLSSPAWIRIQVQRSAARAWPDAAEKDKVVTAGRDLLEQQNDHCVSDIDH